MAKRKAQMIIRTFVLLNLSILKLLQMGLDSLVILTNCLCNRFCAPH